MSAQDSLLFIDSNKYLDLYRTNKGKKLIGPLREQAGFIFITKQVVSEIKRNKVLVAASFLSEQFKELRLESFAVPDHLTGLSPDQADDIHKQLKDLKRAIEKINQDINAYASAIIKQISLSEDDVSKALEQIFSKAIDQTPEEVEKSKLRRELGNPPGKRNDPLGDQLTWEQILTHFKGKKRLWIISRDGDYGTKYKDSVYINGFLYEDLCKVVANPEVYLFEDIAEGLRHFVEITGTKAEQQLTPEEIKEISNEEKSLPPPFFSTTSFFDATSIVTEAERARQYAEIIKSAIPRVESFTPSIEALSRVASPINVSRKIQETIQSAIPKVESLSPSIEALSRVASPTNELRKIHETIQSLVPRVESPSPSIEALSRIASPINESRKTQETIQSAIPKVESLSSSIEALSRVASPISESKMIKEEIQREIPSNENHAPLTKLMDKPKPEDGIGMK
jgi:hypothetical protein